VSQILKPVVALYAMKVIETNLGWYLSEGLLSTQVGAAVPQHIRYSSMPFSKTCKHMNIANDCWQISRICTSLHARPVMVTSRGHSVPNCVCPHGSCTA